MAEVGADLQKCQLAVNLGACAFNGSAVRMLNFEVVFQLPKFTDRYSHVSFNSAALEQLCVILTMFQVPLDLMHPVSLMEACASFGFASGVLEQAKFGVPMWKQGQLGAFVFCGYEWP